MKKPISFFQKLDIYQILSIPLLLVLIWSLVDLQPSHIKIGVILPITGENPMATIHSKYGVELAIKHINESGGINGSRIEAIIKDNAESSTTTANECKKLIYEDNVLAIIGGHTAHSTRIIKYICEKTSTPFLTSSCTSPEITRDGRKFTFRSIPDDVKQLEAIISCLKKRFDCRKIAVIQDRYHYGPEIEKAIRDTSLNYGLPIIAKVTCSRWQINFRKQLEIIKASHADGLIILSTPTKSALILRQAREMGIKTPVLGGNCMSDPLFIRNAGIYAESAMATLPFNPRQGKQRAEYFLSEYSDIYSIQADSHAALAYEAVILTSIALKLGAPNKHSIRDAFASMHGWASITGSGGFDSMGNQVKPSELSIIRKGQPIPMDMERLF